jgi:hypothetical protein
LTGPGCHESLHLVGIGELSGGTYGLNNVQRFGFQSEDPVMVAAGQLNWDFTVVINGTGDVVLNTETFDVVCR